MKLSHPKQINDLIAVRLFTFGHDGITRRISSGAYSWAKNRGIQVAVIDKKSLYILLPEEYEGYLNWSDVGFTSSALVDIFRNSLDIVEETGWSTVKRYVRPFEVAEKSWIMEHAPNQYSWLTKR